MYGVEPSDRVRELAERNAAHPAVTYLKGSAEEIPLPEASVDGVLMFLSFHHFPDQLKAVQEVRRVLARGGEAFLRSQFADHMPDLFWYEYFPSGREVDAAMYLSVGDAARLARAAGLDAADEPVWVSTEKPRTLRETYDRVKLRALSTFEHIPVDELEPGFERFAADGPGSGSGHAAAPVRDAGAQASQLTFKAVGFRKTRPRGAGESGGSRRPGS